MWLKYFVLTGARGFSGGANLLIIFFIVGSTSAEVVGELARMLNWTAFLAPYLTLGLVPYFTRELAKRSPAEQLPILNQARRHVALIFALGLVGFALGEWLRDGESLTQISQVLRAIAIACVFAGSLIFAGVMRGLGQPLWGDLPIYLAIPIFYAVGILLFMPNNSSHLFLIYGSAHLVAWCALAFNFGRFSNWSVERPARMFFSATLLTSTASTNLVSAGQLALAGAVFEAEEMANLHLAFVFANSVNLAFASVIAIHQRRISRAHSTGDKGLLQNEINSMNKSLFGIGVILFVALILAIPIIVKLLPEGYGNFTLIAPLFLLGQFFNFLGGPSAMFYLMVGEEKHLNYVLISTAIIGLTLAFFAANLSLAHFVLTLCAMTFSWNAALVFIAWRRFGVRLYVTSFLRAAT